MTTQFLHGVETIELNDGVRPVKTAATAAIALIGTADDADADIFPMHTPVLLAGTPRKAVKLGASGTLYNAVKQVYAEAGAAVCVIRVPSAADSSQQLTNCIGSEATRTGVYAALNAKSLCGIKPKTLIAPGFTSQTPLGGNTNPVVNAMLAVAAKVRGRVYADCPLTSEAAALAYRAAYASARLTVFYPAVEVWDDIANAFVARPASSSNAGLTARVHTEHGFWFSPSNFAFNGVGGVSSPIDYFNDPNDQADILNSNQLTLTMTAPDEGYPGWRRWGNSTCADDELWRFECVRSTADAIYESIQAAQAYAVDKPPSLQLLRDMSHMMQGYLNYLKKLGAIVGGKVWLDVERNPPQQTSQGIWAWDYDPEPIAPMEHIQNYAHRNTDYYASYVTDVAAALAGA